jgi:O-antigen/teichoic acid export membrane protein
MTWKPGVLLRSALHVGVGPAALYLGASLVAKAAWFVLIPLYTRRMSVAQYGDFALAQTLVAMLPMLLSLGLSSAVMRFYFDGRDHAASRAKVGGAARWLALITIGSAALLQSLLLLFWPAGRSGIAGRWELSCILWAGAGGALAEIPAVYLRAAQRAIPAALFKLAQFLSILVSGLLLVGWLDRGLRGAIEASALAFVVDGSAGLAYIIVALKGPMTRRLLREALSFSLPFVPHFAAGQLQTVSDRWTMKVVGLQVGLGEYGLASQLVQPVAMTLGAWHDAASPQMGELAREEGAPGLRRRFKWFLGSYMLSAILPGAVLILGLPVLAWFVGGKFLGALWIVPFLAASIVVETVYYPNFNVLFFVNRTRPIPVITVSAALLNLGLNILLIRWFGIAGALLSRFLSMGYRSGAMWFAARHCFAEAPPAASPQPST